MSNQQVQNPQSPVNHVETERSDHQPQPVNRGWQKQNMDDLAYSSQKMLNPPSVDPQDVILQMAPINNVEEIPVGQCVAPDDDIDKPPVQARVHIAQDVEEQRESKKKKKSKEKPQSKCKLCLCICLALVLVQLAVTAALFYYFYDLIFPGQGQEDPASVVPVPIPEVIVDVAEPEVPLPEPEQKPVYEPFEVDAVTQEYESLLTLDFPQRRQKYPSDRILQGLTQKDIENYQLTQIVTTQDENGDLTGLQMVFKNGLQSPQYEQRGRQLSEISVAEIDQSRRIGFVSMKVDQGLYYNGIRFFDKDQMLMNEHVWIDDYSGQWTPVQSLRSNERIIGLQFNNDQGRVTHLSLLLAKIDEAQISRELRFPEMDAFPSLAQYKQFISNDAFSQLERINFKESDGKLTGIQLEFEDGVQSPLLESIYATTDKLEETGLILYRQEYREWLDCIESGQIYCFDANGQFNACYQSGRCDSLADPGWFDCYWSGEGCEGINVKPRPVQVEFDEWLECYNQTNRTALECGDIDGSNLNCYTNAKCEGITDEYWFNCFWHEYQCDGKSEDDMNFEEWLHCYTMTLTANCGGVNGPKYRRCYLQGDCQGVDIEPGWFDCYWHGKCGVDRHPVEEKEPSMRQIDFC